MSSYILQGDRGYWRAILALFFGSFVTFAVLYCTQPLIPLFSTVFGTTPSAASLTVSLATGSLSVFLIIMAWISDAVGRKRMMAFSLLGSAALTIAAAYCESFSFLLAIRALQGALLAGFPAIAMAYVNEEFDPRRTGLIMGIYVSGTSVGGMLGRVLVSAVTDLYSWQVALLFIGAVSLAVSAWFWLGLPESRNFRPLRRPFGEMVAALARQMHQPALAALFLTGFLIMGAFVSLYNYIGYSLMAPPYNLSQTLVGMIFLVYLLGTVSSTLLGRLADRWGSAGVLTLAISIMLAGGLVTLGESLILKIAGIAVFTFGFFGSHSVASGTVAKLAGTDKAQASALYLLLYYLGSSVLGTLGGKFLTWFHWGGVVGYGSFLLLLALLIIRLAGKKMSPGRVSRS